MADVGSLQSSSTVTGNLLRAADQNTAVVAALLKKTAEADKNLVDKLLPAAGTEQGTVNIRA